MTTEKNDRTNGPRPVNSSAEPVFVSDVIGEGKLAHRRAAVGLWVFTIPGANGTEPLIRDLDAAARLGFARPRDIRKLIERLWPENARPIQRATVARRNVRGGGVQEYRVDEYWLTEAELLKLCARAETKVAEAVLDEMIAVYMAVRRGLLPRPAPAVPLQLATEVSALRAAVVELQRELASGTIGPDVALDKIVTPLRRIAALRGATGRDRKAERARYDRRLRNLLGHARRGATWARLDRKLLGVAEVHLGEWLDTAIRDARKRPAGQLTLNGVEPPKPN
jgi:hypothetical protein